LLGEDQNFAMKRVKGVKRNSKCRMKTSWTDWTRSHTSSIPKYKVNWWVSNWWEI